MDRRIRVAAVLLVLFAVALAWAPQARAAEMSLDDAFKQLASYKFGQSRVALTAISNAVRDSAKKPAERKKLAARLAAMLGDAKVTTDAKRFICRKLSLIGTADQVPALAKLLADKDLADMGRYALERIPGEQAVAAVREALSATSGRIKIGMINTLGERADAQSVAALVELLSGADAAQAEAAAAALGKIGGEKALAALTAARPKASAKLKPAVTNAVLVCADKLVAAGKKAPAAAVFEKLYSKSEPTRVQIAALRGLVAAKGAEAVPLVLKALQGEEAAMRAAASAFIREMAGEDVTKAFAAALGKLDAGAKVLVLTALGDRGDKAASPAVAAALKDDDAKVRAAAIRALGSVGDATSVPALAKAVGAADAGERAAAASALRRIAGDHVDAAISQEMMKAPAKAKVELIRALADRKAASTTLDMLKAAQDKDGSVRGEAVKALGQMGDPNSLPQMVQLLLKADANEQSAWAASIAMVARRVKDEAKRVAPILSALKSADTKAKAALLMALGRIGSGKALSVLKDALKDAAPEVQEAAVRALSNWPDEGAAPELLNVAKTHKELKIQVLALRGFVNVVSKVSDQNKRLQMLAEAMDVAKRADEKKMILGAVANVRSGRAVGLLTKYLDDKALQREAAAGIFRLARDRRVRRSREIKAARAKILASFTDAKIVNQAKKLPK